MPSINFRGPILFIKDNAANTFSEARVPYGDPKIAKHEDGTKAIPHYSMLGMFDQSGNHVAGSPISLHNCRVVIADVSGKPCLSKSDLKELPYLREITDNLTLNNGVVLGTELATGIKFNGGELTAGLESALTWQFTGDYNPKYTRPKRKLPLAVTWSTSVDATIEISGAVNGTIRVDGTTDIYIYNYESLDPKKDALDGEERFKPGDHEDDDFKWLYRLLTPPSNDWDAWREGKHLPAPISFTSLQKLVGHKQRLAAKFEGKAVTEDMDPFPLISGCFDAVWDL